MVIPTVTGLTALQASSGENTINLHIVGTCCAGAAAPPRHAGHLTITRPARRDDLDLVNSMHARCTPASRLARYQSAVSALSETQWDYLIDPDVGGSWVTHEPDREDVIAVSHLTAFADAPHDVDLGILVEDDWQQHGLGSALTHRALGWAKASGYRTVRAMTGTHNEAMLKILRRAGAAEAQADTGDTIDFTLDLTSWRLVNAA
jgi:RimJ/RimL family protein N-acetyltransferase